MFSLGAEINSKRSIIVIIWIIYSFFSEFQDITELFIHTKVKIRSKSMSYFILRKIMFYLTSFGRGGRISLLTRRLPLTLGYAVLFYQPSVAYRSRRYYMYKMCDDSQADKMGGPNKRQAQSSLAKTPE